MENKVCWKECNKRGGKCSYCDDGFCCNGKEGTYPGWNGDCPTGAIAVAPLKGHRCIRHSETSTSTTITMSTTTSTTSSKTTIDAITELDGNNFIKVPKLQLGKD